MCHDYSKPKQYTLTDALSSILLVNFRELPNCFS